MNINTGVVYKFEFLTKFNKFNGVYLVNKILTYQETIEENVNLYNECYSPVGLTEKEFEDDSFGFRIDRIFKLTRKNEVEDLPDILYIPYTLCKVAPDPNVKKYSKLVIDLDLGVFDNEERLIHIAEIMQEHLSAATGIVNLPELTKYKEEWMSISDYELIEHNRNDSLKKVINFFTQCVVLKKENERLKTLVSGYEEKFMELNTL